MERLKKVVRVIPKGQFPDSRQDNRRYWLSRPPEERIAAARELRRETYLRLTGKALPPIAKTVKIIKRRD